MSLDIQPKTSGDVITSADFNAIVSAVDANETAIGDKVDKVTGKGLSTNDYDDTEKGKVSSAYQKPSGGIPKTDLAEGVQASLDLANSALQEHQDISGKQDTLVSGTNIKTINGESVLGNTDISTHRQWKLLGSGSVQDTTHEIQTEAITSGFFANRAYTKFKIVLEITPVDNYTNNYIVPRFWFNGLSSRGYMLFDSLNQTKYIYKTQNENSFRCELLVERWVGDDNWATSSTLITKDGETGKPKFWYKINDGTFENSNTANTLNKVVFNVAGAYQYIKSATMSLYALLGDEEIVPSDYGGGEANVLEGVQVNGTDLTISDKKVNILTETAYNASTNKIATMSDIASAVGDIETALDSINDGLEALL